MTLRPSGPSGCCPRLCCWQHAVDERYWNNRRARHAAMPDGGACGILSSLARPLLLLMAMSSSAARRLLCKRARSPRWYHSNGPSPVSSAPLSAESVTAFPRTSFYDAAGVTARVNGQAPTWRAISASRGQLNRHLSSEQQERIGSAGFDVIPLYELIAQFGETGTRCPSHCRHDDDRKGPTPCPTDQADALKRFRKLTADLHRPRPHGPPTRPRGDERVRCPGPYFLATLRLVPTILVTRSADMARTQSPREWANLSLAEREDRQRHAAQRAAEVASVDIVPLENITVDLNGRVGVRGRGPATAAEVESALNRSPILHSILDAIASSRRSAL